MKNEIKTCWLERDRLREAAKKVDAELLPYRGPDMSPEKTYLVSRAAVQQLRAALTEGAKPQPKLKTAAALRVQDLEERTL